MTTREYTEAGVVTRMAAAAVDALVVGGIAGTAYLGWAAAVFLWFPATFSWPRPGPLLSLPVLLAIASGYCAAAWAGTGRTLGNVLLGLRVLSVRRRLLGWPRATARALLCAVFPLGLLWAAVNRSRRSVQDLLFGSVVVYDPHQDGGAAAFANAPTGEPPRSRPASPPARRAGGSRRPGAAGGAPRSST